MGLCRLLPDRASSHGPPRGAAVAALPTWRGAATSAAIAAISATAAVTAAIYAAAAAAEATVATFAEFAASATILASSRLRRIVRAANLTTACMLALSFTPLVHALSARLPHVPHASLLPHTQVCCNQDEHARRRRWPIHDHTKHASQLHGLL